MAIDKQTEEILLDVIENDDFSSLKPLLNQGLNIDDKFADGETILHKCFALRKYNITQHLVLLGADIFSNNNLNRTPLHIGARSGFIEGTHLYTLLANNLNQQDHKGRIPLMHAIKFKQMLLVKVLMAKGSDTDLKDNNGYSSLMWAVKYLDPAELKELMENSSDEEIQNQIQECIDNEMKVDVAEETLEQAQQQANPDENADKSEVEENVLPNPIAEMITKPETEEHVAPYSITDHIESLKVKAKEEGFDYEITTLPQEKRVNSDGDIETIESEKVERPDSNIESFTRNVSGEPRPSSSEAHIPEKEEMTIVRGSGESGNPELERQEIQSRPTNGEPDLLEREEVQRVSGKEPELIDNNIQEIKRPEMEVTTQEMEKIQRATTEDTPTSQADPIRRSDSQVTPIKSSEESGEENDLGVMTGKGGTDVIKEESSVVKGLEGDDSADDLWKSESKGGVDSSSNYEVTKLKKAEAKEEETTKRANPLDESDEKDPIYVKKKEINYIRDGYKEEIKDSYGEIKTVDKSIANDELGDIQTTNKQIAEANTAEIKTVDKTVQSDYEVQEKAPEEAQNSHYSRVEGAPVLQSTDDKIEVTERKIETVKEEIKRPEMNVQPIKNDTEEIQRVSSQKTSESEDDFMTVSSKNSKDADEDTVVESNLPTEKADENTSIEGTTEVIENEETIVEDEDTVTEDGEKLTVEEQKVVKQMVDTNQKNKKGQTLCWLAAEKGQSALLKKLIQKGADYEIKDTQGVSPLMAASIKGHTEVVEYLAHKVRNIDEKRRDGQTALTLAIEADQPDAVKALIDNGASSDAKIKGNTLLMHAASMGSGRCIKVLILLGHDPLEKNFRGKTALDIAKSSRKKKAFALLKKIIESRKAS